MGAKRHVRHAPSGGVAKRDRGKSQPYVPQGKVSWPTMAGGKPWTSDVRRVIHQDDPHREIGTMHPPELVDGAWTAVVDWSGLEHISARVPLDNLIPE